MIDNDEVWEYAKLKPIIYEEIKKEREAKKIRERKKEEKI
jgi:hypothetical protein